MSFDTKRFSHIFWCFYYVKIGKWILIQMSIIISWEGGREREKKNKKRGKERASAGVKIFALPATNSGSTPNATRSTSNPRAGSSLWAQPGLAQCTLGFSDSFRFSLFWLSLPSSAQVNLVCLCRCGGSTLGCACVQYVVLLSGIAWRTQALHWRWEILPTSSWETLLGIQLWVLWIKGIFPNF